MLNTDNVGLNEPLQNGREVKASGSGYNKPGSSLYHDTSFSNNLRTVTSLT